MCKINRSDFNSRGQSEKEFIYYLSASVGGQFVRYINSDPNVINI